jgi:uncharacterized protein YjbI with pentapeptide repeats
MANEEHVAQLNKGADSWAVWRKENPNIRPDLSEADLQNWDLCEADLSGANLCETYLAGAFLIRANLSGPTSTAHTSAGRT